MTEGMRFTTPRHRQVYVAYGTVYDCVDALAAIMFIIGSVLFFKTSTVTAGTWLFLIGSVFFAVRPVVHVVRDVHMKRLPKE
nr:YrhK family protein [uncultured Hyphomonas sp.]